jgi:hypothetical protein
VLCAVCCLLTVVNAAPHSWQNFTPGGLTLPHPAQVASDVSAAPHAPQNFTPSGFAFPHA